MERGSGAKAGARRSPFRGRIPGGVRRPYEAPHEWAGLASRTRASAERLSAELPSAPPVLDLPDLVAASELVVEAVSPESARSVIEQTLRGDRDILVLTVGALVLHPELLELARERGRVIHVPSGAIGGLDSVKAGAVGGLRRVVITCTKSAKSFRGHPEVGRQGIDLDRLEGPRVLFEGTAREAIEKFPANVNISSALSLAGVGADRTLVRVVVDPAADRTVNEVEVEGEFGRFVTRAENVLSPANPRTSHLTSLSALATLRGIADSVRIGT
ncbi:MAG: aspartate dehydrogenase domain-containing protein [Nitrospinota bacterium]